MITVDTIFFFKPALMNFNNPNTCMYYNFTMNKKTTLMNSKTEHYQVLSVFHCYY